MSNAWAPVPSRGRKEFLSQLRQKRAVEFGEWLCGHVLRAIPDRHFVFSIPKILRRFFLHDRKLLVELSRCAWVLAVNHQAHPQKSVSPQGSGRYTRIPTHSFRLLLFNFWTSNLVFLLFFPERHGPGVYPGGGSRGRCGLSPRLSRSQERLRGHPGTRALFEGWRKCL